MRRIIATVDWPWATDKKKSEESKPKARVKSSISGSMKMKPQIYSKRLKPITSIVRKPNGEINTKAVKNLIHSLESMLHEK